MVSYQVDILNPKADRLLKDLADLNLISIRQTASDGFTEMVKRLRAKAASNPLTLEEITKEVEKVRSKRYGKKKG